MVNFSRFTQQIKIRTAEVNNHKIDDELADLHASQILLPLYTSMRMLYETRLKERSYPELSTAGCCIVIIIYNRHLFSPHGTSMHVFDVSYT